MSAVDFKAWKWRVKYSESSEQTAVTFIVISMFYEIKITDWSIKFFNFESNIYFFEF